MDAGPSKHLSAVRFRSIGMPLTDWCTDIALHRTRDTGGLRAISVLQSQVATVVKMLAMPENLKVDCPAASR